MGDFLLDGGNIINDIMNTIFTSVKVKKQERYSKMKYLMI